MLNKRGKPHLRSVAVVCCARPAEARPDFATPRRLLADARWNRCCYLQRATRVRARARYVLSNLNTPHTCEDNIKVDVTEIRTGDLVQNTKRDFY